MKFDEVESSIGYTFKDKSLLKRALTLASASDDNNQLLEFFGDAVLEFIVSEKIFAEGKSEGELTERRKTLVADSALAPVSEKLGLDKYLIRGKKDFGNKKAVPSVYEAVTAAIYLDGGMDEAKRFVLNTLDFSERNAVVNHKGVLQELLQSAGQSCP
ncbi:MAG: ribonuclease III, partial [Clostridia bacterium]|nr:ribonuclease III [Clostridia bacterium]